GAVRARNALKYRIPLLNQVAVLGSPAQAARRRTVLGACAFLERHQEELLSVVRQDVKALERWQGLVQVGQLEFEQRYAKEYLSTGKCRGFDEALLRLMQLLDIPGLGIVLSGTLYVLRTPYRLLRGLVAKAFSRPEAPGRPELPILQDSLEAWLDMLRKEAT